MKKKSFAAGLLALALALAGLPFVARPALAAEPAEAAQDGALEQVQAYGVKLVLGDMWGGLSDYFFRYQPDSGYQTINEFLADSAADFEIGQEVEFGNGLKYTFKGWNISGDIDPDKQLELDDFSYSGSELEDEAGVMYDLYTVTLEAQWECVPGQDPVPQYTVCVNYKLENGDSISTPLYESYGSRIVDGKTTLEDLLHESGSSMPQPGDVMQAGSSSYEFVRWDKPEVATDALSEDDFRPMGEGAGLYGTPVNEYELEVTGIWKYWTGAGLDPDVAV